MVRFRVSLNRVALTMVLSVIGAADALSAQAAPRTTSPCATSADFQRLAFWIGDWDVFDSTGVYYASQRVHAAIDACALTVEWTGRAGDKGFGVSAYDSRARQWKQMYVSNQVPFSSGVKYRTADRGYAGPGVRFVPVFAAGDSTRSQTRVSIVPLANDRVLQLFEDSSDGGATWHVEFKAEHRRHPGGADSARYKTEVTR